jgi:DNA-binding transcriptional MerR regulator/mannose-6-phosphate isomerase-like protein (cupin superfamily)
MSAPPHVGPPSGARKTGEARHRIGSAARQVGVSASALRLWERQGLVAPVRSGSGYRLYTDADLARLRRVRRLRAEELNAPGILRLLAPDRQGTRSTDGDGAVDGRRLRTLRREHGRSLESAAAEAGVSASFLSALERNVAGASVATLQRLTHAYGTTLLDLFRRATPHGRRVRPRERQVLALGSGVRIEQLARDAALLEPQLFVLAAGATSEGAYDHEGEEFLYVLDGAMTIWIGADERYRLGTGDSLTFPSTLPHRWRNRAGGETRLLWINTPPTF